jgi:hypothetical protein
MGASPNYVGWKTYQGDALDINISVESSIGVIDLTSYDVIVKVIPEDDPLDNPTILFESSASDLTIGATAGTVLAELSTAQTLLLPTGKRTKVELRLTPPGGDQKTYFVGRIKVST